MPAVRAITDRPRLVLLTIAVLALALAGCGAQVPRRDVAGDSTSLAAILPTAAADRSFDISAMPPEDLDMNVDSTHKAALRTIAEQHGRSLADFQLASAIGQDGEPTVRVLAIRVMGVPAAELAEVFTIAPEPSAAPLPEPGAETIAGHPVLRLPQVDVDHPVLLLRDDIVFTIIAPDEATLEALVRSVWDAADPAPAEPA